MMVLYYISGFVILKVRNFLFKTSGPYSEIFFPVRAQKIINWYFYEKESHLIKVSIPVTMKNDSYHLFE